MFAAPKPADDAKRFFVWKAPGQTFSIYLSLDVVQKMTRELSRAALEDPPRDINGVLLGRSLAEPYPATVVEDFVFESAEETSSTSSDDTVAQMVWKLVRGTESGRHIVGFFRSQRDGRLAPNELDLTNAGRLLGEPDNALLLIRVRQSGESEATFFYWDGIKTQYHGSSAPFPFDAGQLPATGLTAWSHNGSGSFEQPRLPQWIPTHTPMEPSRWLRLVPTFAIFGLVTAGTEMWWLSRPAAAAAHTAQVTPGEVSPLGLKVTVQPHQLEIRWNRLSTQILAAEQAVLEITEGDLTEKVPVDQQELRDGYVAYTPKTKDVNVRLEISGSDGKRISDSIRVTAIP